MRHIPTTLAASVIALVSTTAAIAGPGPYFGPPGHRPHPHPAPWEGWIAPLVTGTVIGAVIASEPRTVVVERPPAVAACRANVGHHLQTRQGLHPRVQLLPHL